jgi:hypothetical protein
MKRAVDREHRMLRELILYVANRLYRHAKFGATKLNKILFYSDFVAYAELGKSITGEVYWKLPQGPAPRYFVQTREKMLRADEITCYSVNTLSGRQDRIAPKRSADLKKFKPEEISIVERVIEELKDKDAYEVSQLSHEFIGWKIVKDREDIPYGTVFLRDPEEIEVTTSDKKLAKDIAKADGL